MGQISAYQEAPYQGVSQAPPQVRRRDQAEILDNCYVAMPQGLQKRPPWEYVGLLAGHSGLSGGLFHRVERASGDMILTLTETSSATAAVLLYDIATLTAQTVTISTAAQAYLNAGVPTPAALGSHDFGALTVVDNTFIWRKLVNVANSSATNATRPHEAIIWVRGAAYGKKYTVTVTGAGSASVTLRTPDGTTASDSNFVDTDVIANSLVTGAGYTTTDGASISGSLAALSGSGFTVTRTGPVIYLSNAADFQVIVTDGQGGEVLIAAKDKVQKFSDLPAKAPDGFTVRIVQTSSTDADDFFVRFRSTAGDGTGIWEECLAPGAQLGLDPNTMPVTLINDGSWKLQIASWKQRTTGDQTLVKDPDFIGQTIQDVTFWQGRLGIVSGEGVTLSCADDPFQLYPRTLASVLDSDPVARVNPAPGLTTLRFGIPFEGRLVLVGDNIQLEVTEDGTLTPVKARIDKMTAHQVNPLIRPAFVNGKLYYSTPRGSTASGVHEVSVDRVTNVPVGEDLSAAAFKYLPAGIDRSATSPNNYLVVYGTSGKSDLYIHLFRHSDQERVQNAFMRWFLPEDTVLGGMFFVDTVLYVLASRVSVAQAYIIKADFASGVLDKDTTSKIRTYLDMRADETQCTKTLSGPNTLITLPFKRSVKGHTMVVARAPGNAGGTIVEGEPATINAAATNLALSNQIVVVGDWTAVPFYAGHTYNAQWRFSKLYALDSGNKPIRDGRTTIRKVTLDMTSTPYLRAQVTAGGRLVATNTWQKYGPTIDPLYGWFVPPPGTSVEFQFPVRCENETVTIDLLNDSPYGQTVLGFDWVGELNTRSQRT